VARFDPDDDFDDLDDDREPRPDWQRRALTWLLAAAGLGLGFLLPYMLYLNHQVGERFGQLQWQLPTRVYARPLELRPGLAMDAATLKTELDAAGYREDGAGVRPGSYARDEGRWLVASRGFHDVDGEVAPRRLAVRLSGGRVASLADAAREQPLESARLDPARIATLYGQKQEERRLVQLEEVPELLITGLQAVEDRDFVRHRGIDVSGIVRALWVNLKAGEKRQGASTLTQQLARSGLLGIGREQTYARKFNEILYAMLIEARYDKRTILETYLNQVYLGQRGAQAIHGVSAASEFWFGRDMRDLSTEQIALLIGIIRGPSLYDPRRKPEAAKKRRDLVLSVWRDVGLVSADEAQKAMAAPLGVSARPGVASNRNPAFMDLVRRQLARDYPADALRGSGLVVVTTLSPSAQLRAERAVSARSTRCRRRTARRCSRVWCSPTPAAAKCWRWSATATPTSPASIVRSRRSVRSARCSSPSSTCWRWRSPGNGRWPAGSTTQR
jgi:penicillin-binding protein 1B